MTAVIAAALMEKVGSDSRADYLLAGGEAVGTRQLRIGGGVALAVPGDPAGSWNMTSGAGLEEPVNYGLLERIIDVYLRRAR
jgi:hypothetical protein